MIILDDVTKTLEIVLGGAVTTNEIPFVSNYVDITSTTFEAIEEDGQSNGATPVTIVSAPAASTQRQIKFLSIVNIDTAQVDITISYNNNSTLRTLITIGLGVGYTIQYTDGEGWRVLDETGAILTFISTGAAITSLTGDVTATGPGAAVATLANTAVTPGMYGDATHVPQITVDSKGRLTLVSSVVITDTGITQLTGDGTAGPGSGSQAFTLAASGVTAGTYGDATHVPQITVDAKGRVTAVSSIVITDTGITQLTSDVTAGPGSGSQAATIAANAVTDGKFRQSAGLSVVGRSANSTGNVADITAASDGQVVRRSGTTIGFGAVDLASANAVTGLLPRANVNASLGQLLTILAGSATFNPADSTSYYCGLQPNITPSTSTVFSLVMPKAGTIKVADVAIVVAGTLGSTETFTIRVRNVTAATTENITTTAQANTITQAYSNTSMSLAFSAGDALVIELVTPAWATNPTAVFVLGGIYVEM